MTATVPNRFSAGCAHVFCGSLGCGPKKMCVFVGQYRSTALNDLHSYSTADLLGVPALWPARTAACSHRHWSLRSPRSTGKCSHCREAHDCASSIKEGEVYYSMYGHVKKLADEIAASNYERGGRECPQQLADYDGVLFGIPTHPLRQCLRPDEGFLRQYWLTMADRRTCRETYGKLNVAWRPPT
ncbi:unnamed protein product [Symbiodinium sp. KB8]|nr:unnamed protein product [Symbiodinium sp. KB8]